MAPNVALDSRGCGTNMALSRLRFRKIADPWCGDARKALASPSQGSGVSYQRPLNMLST